MGAKSYKITLLNKDLEYFLRSYKRSKKIRLKILATGQLNVSKPFWVSRRIVEKFLCANQDWIIQKISWFNQNKLRFQFGDYNQDKELARDFIYGRLKFFKKFYNFEVNKIFVRNQKTRWGSCSAQKNLNFNYRILYLPIELVDYVIVHEICHLFELNHSANFWSLVEQQLPDYKLRRKKLKQIIF